MQSNMSAEQELKDKDSVFRELYGTTVHYKLAQGIQPQHPTAMHCYHGFGANTFSWSYVYKSLSEQLQAQVTKHDMPGFGLTLRPKDLSGYTLDYNGRLGRHVMDAELAAAGVLHPSEAESELGPAVKLADLHSVSDKYHDGQKEAEPALDAATLQAAAAKQASVSRHSKTHLDSPTSSLEYPGAVSDTDRRNSSSSSSSSNAESPRRDTTDVKIKRVLVGHSVGAACAAAEYINHPEVAYA